jgi:hypothetical protein
MATDAKTSTHLKGTYRLKSWDEKTWDGKPYTERKGAKLTHAVITYAMQGGFEGEGHAQLVMSYRDEANATYVGLQEMVGKIGDRSGTFVCKVDGGYAGGEAKSTWEIIPGSGTGDFAGISGRGDTTAVHGDTQPYTFDYTFE